MQFNHHLDIDGAPSPHRSFKFRHHFSNLHVGSSTRPDSTCDQIFDDNKWRLYLTDLIVHPWLKGVAYDQGALHSAIVLAMDETPLPYLPRSRCVSFFLHSLAWPPFLQNACPANEVQKDLSHK